MGDIVRVELDRHFDIGLGVVFFQILDWDVQVVKAEEVGSDDCDPVLTHFKILRILIVNFLEHLRDLFDFLHEVFDEDTLVLFFNLALEVDVNKEIAALRGYRRVDILDCNGPQSVLADQLLEVNQVQHFKLACLGVVVDVAMLCVHVQEEHTEAAEAVDAEVGAVKLIRVAHNLLEDVGAASLIQQVLSLPTDRCVVLLLQEVKEDFLLVISNAVTDHGLEESLDVVEGEVTTLRVRDHKFNEAHEDVDVLLVRDVVVVQFEVFLE